MSAPQKPMLVENGLHNVLQKPGEIHITQELSTFSTGFSTSSSGKSVDKSGMISMYTIFSTVLHNSVECSVIYITTLPLPLGEVAAQRADGEGMSMHAAPLSRLCRQLKSRALPGWLCTRLRTQSQGESQEKAGTRPASAVFNISQTESLQRRPARPCLQTAGGHRSADSLPPGNPRQAPAPGLPELRSDNTG